jgi:C4-dicarboxylate-specific signal transduction histidine kinase
MVYDIDRSLVISAYQNRFGSIIKSLLNNSKEAIDYRKVQEGIIKISLYKDESWLVISIEDNGGGISSDILDKIFEPYFSTKDQKHGVGLSLYICKTVIELHLKGNMRAYNGTYGAVFEIRLPL